MASLTAKPERVALLFPTPEVHKTVRPAVERANYAVPPELVFERDHALPFNAQFEGVVEKLKKVFIRGSRVRIVVPYYLGKRQHTDPTGVEVARRLLADPHFANARVVVPRPFKRNEWEAAVEAAISRVPEAQRPKILHLTREDFEGNPPLGPGRIHKHFA